MRDWWLLRWPPLGSRREHWRKKWIWEGWERFPAASIIMAPELSCRALQDWIVFLNCDKGLFWFNTVLKRMISAWIYHPIGMKYTLQIKGLTSDLKCTLQHKGARMRSALRQGLHRNWSTVRAISVAAGSVKMKNNHKHRTTHTVMFIQYYNVKNVVVFFLKLQIKITGVSFTSRNDYFSLSTYIFHV